MLEEISLFGYRNGVEFYSLLKISQPLFGIVEIDMASFWQMIKKYPYIAGILLLLFFTMLARVQGDIATLFERSLINFISGITLIICVLYGFLYISGSLNPGDKSYIDFKKISDTLLKGSSKK